MLTVYPAAEEVDAKCQIPHPRAQWLQRRVGRAPQLGHLELTQRQHYVLQLRSGGSQARCHLDDRAQRALDGGQQFVVSNITKQMIKIIVSEGDTSYACRALGKAQSLAGLGLSGLPACP